MTARLNKALFFDARAAWGQAANQVSPFGTYQDSFATTRALASAKLRATGARAHGASRRAST